MVQGPAGVLQVHSTKAYLDSRDKYFRFLPKESPPQLSFPVSGTEVELSMSDMKVVHLTNISLASAGQYQCEVRKDISSLLTILPPHQGQH